MTSARSWPTTSREPASDVEGFEHLNGIMADDVGDGDELGDDHVDDLGDDELAAAAAMDDDG